MGGATRKRTSPAAWAAAALLGLAIFVGLASRDPGGAAAPACRPIDAGVIRALLGPERAEAVDDMLAAATRLNADGRCVIEGGWGASYGRFFLAVQDAGTPPARAYFIRATRDELRAMAAGKLPPRRR